MQTVEQIQERLGVPIETIREFCERWNIVEFALFGSIVRDDFGPDSDVDVLVRFAEGKRPRGLNYFGLGPDLEDIIGRDVDVIERGTVKNPFVRASIARDLTVLYAA